MHKTKVKFIAKGNNETLEKFTNYVMKEGKKTIARKIMLEAFQIISDKTKQDPTKIFEMALENSKPALEVRPRRIGGAVYQIPMEVKPKRQLQLSARWLLASARDRSGAKMAKRLAEELMMAANNEGNAIKKKEDSHRMAQANKAFAHFAKF